MSDFIPIEGYQPTQGPDPNEPPTGGGAIPATRVCAVCGGQFNMSNCLYCRLASTQDGVSRAALAEYGYKFGITQPPSEWIELGDGGVVLRYRVSAVTSINPNADPRLQPYREEGYLSYVYLADCDMQVPSKRKAEDLAAELMGTP